VAEQWSGLPVAALVAKTGSKEQTVESSLVLFDTQGQMIFEAPPR
jgi:hypothetical protein